MNQRLFAALAALLLGAALCARADVPRPEHPRPDCQRQLWLNLNGTWQFEIDDQGDGAQRGLSSGHDLAQKITVPFCPESKLSGLGLATNYLSHVWYRRHFQVPETMQGKRLLLHFGAVDWLARVWINGQLLGEHHGGYTPFQFEITDFIREADNEVVVEVIDNLRSGLQAAGKQSPGKSEGCIYTRTIGIWQTVWLEAVGDTYLSDFVLTPDLDGSRLLFQGTMNGPSKGVELRIRAYADGIFAGEDTVRANWRNTFAVLKIRNPIAWEPGKPFLYDLKIETLRNGEIIDTISSYFGMRKITIEGNRFLINDKPVFQRLILDQGFYPDGIYTAPTDDALRKDIELSMSAGFNGARFHQKVFEPRSLYWADKLGYLVWGEYPSWGVHLGDAEAVRWIVNEWREALVRDRNHPAIIGWCPLNETGTNEGIARMETLLATTLTMDPTRPFLDSSGYTHFLPETDIYDCHDYDQNPASFNARYARYNATGQEAWNNFPADPRSQYRGQPFFVSEYGGISIKTDRDTGAGWGYNGAALPLQEFLARYKGLTDAQLDNPNIFGFCYTQLTDVEQEHNGVYFYDRQPKFDPALLRPINQRAAAYETQRPRIHQFTWKTVLPTSQKDAQQWRYTLTAPATNWFAGNFNDSTWTVSKGGFGSVGTPGAVIGTEWKGADIWLRKTFTLENTDFIFAALNFHHDEDTQVYVNGIKVSDLTGFTTAYQSVPSPALANALVPGKNTLAIHCRNTAGGQYIDCGIEVGLRKTKK